MNLKEFEKGATSKLGGWWRNQNRNVSTRLWNVGWHKCQQISKSASSTNPKKIVLKLKCAVNKRNRYVLHRWYNVAIEAIWKIVLHISFALKIFAWGKYLLYSIIMYLQVSVQRIILADYGSKVWARYISRKRSDNHEFSSMPEYKHIIFAGSIHLSIAYPLSLSPTRP